MLRRPVVAGLLAIAALAAGSSGSATAAQAPLASLTPKSVATAAVAGPPKRCRVWRVQGQTWFGRQSNGYTLMFTLRSSTSNPSRFGGYAQEYQGMSQRNLVGSQLITGGVGTMSGGYVGVHMDIAWSNGSRGQYNALAYDAQPTASGGLTASLHGTTVDTTGNGASARWVADGLEGPLGDTSHLRPLYCQPRDVVR